MSGLLSVVDLQTAGDLGCGGGEDCDRCGLVSTYVRPVRPALKILQLHIELLNIHVVYKEEPDDKTRGFHFNQKWYV